MSSGVTLDTLQDKQLLDDFVEATRGVYVLKRVIEILIIVIGQWRRMTEGPSGTSMKTTYTVMQ